MNAWPALLGIQVRQCGHTGHTPSRRVGGEAVQGGFRPARGTSLRVGLEDGQGSGPCLSGRTLGPLDLEGIEIIGLDEFAVQKGHRYATVYIEPTRKRVRWIGRGHGREDIGPFFEALGPERCQRLKAAVMDMNTGFNLEVKHHCPNAAIVLDLFHVVAKHGREVIDRVRVDRANELRADRPSRRVIKGARWLLLKNRDSLRAGEDVELDELLAANRSLFVVYVLRDALKELWSLRNPKIASVA